jgi:hypothetical protein
MAQDIMKYFMVMIAVQLFFAASVTTLAYTLPSEMVHKVEILQSSNTNLNLDNLTTTLQSSVERQRSVPIIDMGALIFYSGNIVLDLIVNFVGAGPAMITMAFKLISLLFGGMDIYITSIIQGVITILMFAWYIISLLTMITNMRAGGKIIG